MAILLSLSITTLVAYGEDITEEQGPPTIVAAGTISYSNGAYTVDYGNYNIESVLPVSQGVVYITFSNPLPTTKPIVQLTVQRPMGSGVLSTYDYLNSSQIIVTMKSLKQHLIDSNFSIIVYAYPDES